MAENTDERPAPQRAAVAAPAVTTQDVAKALADLTRAPEGPAGPNASSNVENPAEHYVLASDGKTKLNAYGEEKGSAEDKRRMAALGFS